MTAKDFVEEKLRFLISIFKGVHIKYKYMPVQRSHLVEVIPAEFMQGNEDYFKEEAQIIEEFDQLFPDESIDFISNDSDITIDKADLELYSR
ncbi:MAG TPA: hypothetical protein VK205_03480 [Prolixibacteraceae bacterium]|nr:hypothetical protein [Prolixibacteraceae bacterium]